MLRMKQIFGVTNVKISLATRQHGVIGVLMNIFLIKIISFKFPEINLLNYLANQIKQKRTDVHGQDNQFQILLINTLYLDK